MGGPIDADPWLVFGAVAAPGSIGAGGQLALVTAGVGANSDGVTLPATGPFPSVPVGFTTTLGSVTASATTVGSEARGVLTSGAVTGTATVTAALDNATATAPVAIVSLAGPPGPTGPDGPAGPAGPVGPARADWPVRRRRTDRRRRSRRTLPSLPAAI